MHNEEQLAWSLGAICSSFSCICSLYLIWTHFANFTNPEAQSKIVGIIWLAPIYSVSAWFGLRFKHAAIYLDLMRGCYEGPSYDGCCSSLCDNVYKVLLPLINSPPSGYVMYLFLSLMIELLGRGEEERVIRLINWKPVMKYPFPVSVFMMEKNLPRGRVFLGWAKFGTLQYCIAKPACALIAAFLSPFGLYENGIFDPVQGWIWLTIVQSASVSVAFYCLFTFYVVLKEPLEPFNAFSKFLCIKAILFVSYWQGVVLAIVAYFGFLQATGSWTSNNIQVAWQDLLICVEMAALSLAHTFAFTAEPYKDGNVVPLSGNFLDDHFSRSSVIRDFNEVMPFILPSGFKPGPAESYSQEHSMEVDEGSIDDSQKAWWMNEKGEEVEYLHMTLDSTGTPDCGITKIEGLEKHNQDTD